MPNTQNLALLDVSSANSALEDAFSVNLIDLSAEGKEPLNGDDIRFEDDFFGRRALSIGDIIGTPTKCNIAKVFELEATTCTSLEELDSDGARRMLDKNSDSLLNCKQLDEPPAYKASQSQETNPNHVGTSSNYRSPSKYTNEDQRFDSQHPTTDWLSNCDFSSQRGIDTDNTSRAYFAEHNSVDLQTVPQATAVIQDVRSSQARVASERVVYDYHENEKCSGQAPPPKAGRLLDFDASPGSLHFFNQAGVHITTRDLQHDFVVAQNNRSVGGCLDIDHSAEIEKDLANHLFFDDTAPLNRSKDSAGHEAAVESTEDLQPAYFDDLADEDYYFSPTIRIKEHICKASPQSDWPCNSTRSTAFASDASVERDAILPPPNPTHASATSVSFQLCREPFKSSAIFQRRVGQNFNPSPQKAPAPSNPRKQSRRANHQRSVSSFVSSTSSLSNFHASSAEENITSTTSHPVLLPPSTHGFPTQFDLPLPTDFYIPGPKTQYTFGNPIHPNGLIIHCAFIAATDMWPPTTPRTTNATPTPPSSIITYLHDLSATLPPPQPHPNSPSPSTSPTPPSSTTFLRIQTHRECALARLEGVPVGYYRYFLGWQTVEDYIAHGICVCWDECWCHGLCTRFGDLRCPCARWVEVVGDEEL